MNQARLPAAAPSAWADALLVAQILAVDAAAVGGVVLSAGHGVARDVWLEHLRGLLQPQTPMRRVPVQITEERLIGGLDLAATLASGHAVLQRGVLAECHRGIAVVAMAERLERGTAARIAAALDDGEVRLERDGFSRREPAVVGLVLLDESGEAQPGVPPVLQDRVAILMDLHAVTLRDTRTDAPDVGAVLRARGALDEVRCGDDALVALCAAAAALGIDSLRVPFMALQVARVLAALEGRQEVAPEDLRTAARLVLGPRALHAAPAEEPADADPPDQGGAPQPESQEQSGAPTPSDLPAPDRNPGDSADARDLRDQVLAAARATLPADLLAARSGAEASAGPRAGMGRAGALQASLRRGRPAGVRRGQPRHGSRLSVIDTLRAAAPWQRLRHAAGTVERPARIQLRVEDFHVRRYHQRSETLTVFVVDASGSAAMHRLAEAKGAVELLLAQCYVRRDRVAVIAFRNRGAEVLVPPTRSLLRVRRCMAGLAGGGGTPLAAGLHAAARLAESAQRAGLSPTLVFLTDGRGNLTLAGVGNREGAGQEALAGARMLRAARWRSILIDTSPRPAQAGQALAREMGGVYLPLPYADPAQMAQAVRRVSEAPPCAA